MWIPQHGFFWEKLIPKYLIYAFHYKSQTLLVKIGRDNYVCFDENYGMWIFNPKWKIIPSIAFVKNIVPLIMTGRNHNGGTPKLIFHTFRKPYHFLSSSNPDQLCHDAIKIHTMKLLKAAKYSNNFQVHKQQGNCNGVGTCTIKNYGQFGFCSKLLH